jgi:hypothetical protein
VYFFDFSNWIEKKPSMFAITERLVSVTETEAPGIGSLLRLITFPESVTAFCAATAVIDAAITVNSNKVFENNELRIVQFDDVKFPQLRNPYVTPMLTNCIHRVKPMLSTEVVVDN